MQLTYNKFKQVVSKSSERIFNKIASTMAMSENAALVAMFDDKLVLLDEKKEQLYLSDYLYENGILKIHNHERIKLSENDDTYLDQVTERYFDLDDDTPISIQEMMTGFNLRFKNKNAGNEIITEARDRKYRAIMESPRIKAIRTVREVKNLFTKEINKLWEEDWMMPLSLKADNAKDAIPNTLKSVKFDSPYDVTIVNTEVGEPAPGLLKISSETNVMKAMTDLASKVDQKWKSDSFRKAFANTIEALLKTESVELAKTTILNFLDENKELFLLDEKKLEELLVKTSLMINETDTDSIVGVVNKIIESKAGKQMKWKYFRENAITESKLSEFRMIMEDDEQVAAAAPAPADGSAAPALDAAAPAAPEAEKEDIDWEQVEAIKGFLNKIRGELDDDSDEAKYVDGLLGKLDKSKLEGIDKGSLKEIMDLLKPEDESNDEEPDGDSDDVTGEADASQSDDKELEL